MFNGENELDSLISSGSNYRSKFNRRPRGETLQSMISVYIKNIPDGKNHNMIMRS